MKKLFTFLFLFSLTTLAISQDHIVETMGNTAFNPTDLTITVGQTVQWVNTGGNHNVNGTTTTYPNNPESFGNAVGAGWTFDHTFNTVGTYNYQCDPHVGLGMAGTITVEAAPVNALMITGVADPQGSNGSGGTAFGPRAIELYAFADIADMSIYGIGSANNGGGTDSIEFSFPAIAVTAGSCITLSDSATVVKFTNFFGAAPTILVPGQVTGINGDDAIELFLNGDVVDVFGDINVDGSGQPWEYLDGWAYRKAATGPDGSTFNADNWTYSGVDALQSDVIGDTTNVSFANPFPLCSYSSTPPPALMITGVADPQGANGSGGTAFGPRAIELYAIDDIADLSIYGIGSANNGGGTDSIEFSFPAIAVTAGSCITLADSTVEAKFTSFFGMAPTILVDGQVTAINGDDAIELFMNGDVIDVFGDINVDGSGQPWEYTDGWAYRKNTTGPDGSTFVVDNWTYSGIDALQSDVDSVNTLFANPFPLCSYSSLPPTDLTASNDDITVDQNVATNLDVLANDITPNAVTILAVTSGATSGTVTANGTTDFTYTPNMDFCGTDQFMYEVCDANTCDTATVNITVTCPATSPLIIAGVADPQPSDGGGGNTAGPKMVELYVLEDIADLSIYGVGAANNGGGTDGIEYTFPAVSASAGDCITYTDSLNEANFETFFGFPATFLVPSGGTSASGINGDDAIELFENGVVVDVFGDPNVDGTGTAWDYVDGWAYRNFGEGPNQGTFDETKWSYSGPDALQDNANTMNSQYGNPFPTCTYALTPPPPAYSIGLVTADSDGNLVADSVDVVCRLTGVIHGIDYDGNDGYSFTIIDAAGDGINVHSFNDVDSYVVAEGDEVTVQGFLLNFNGLDEIRAEKITMNSAGNALVTPTDVSTLDEDSESQFIKMTDWTMVTPSQWLADGSSFNVDITDGTNIYQMRIDSDTELAAMPIPAGDFFNITGIGGQYDDSGNAILNMGYQIFPRYTSDIEGFVSTINPELGNKIKFYPNPTSDNLQIRSEIQLDNIRITNMLGQQVAELQNPNLNENVNVNNWQTGIYMITFISGNEIWTSQFVKN